MPRTALSSVDQRDNRSYIIHSVARYGAPEKEWRVAVSYELDQFRCSCMRMECFGVPCEHILAMLVLNNICELPRQLILPSWTKDAKSELMETTGIMWDSLHLTQHWCLMDWYRKVCKVACHRTDRFHFARQMAMQILDHFEKEDSADVNLRGITPFADGGNALNPTKRRTKRTRVGHNWTTCPMRNHFESLETFEDDMFSRTSDMVEPELTGELDPTVEMTSMAGYESQSGFRFHTSDCGRNNVDPDAGVFVSPSGTSVVGGVGSEGFMSLDD
ncbi:hypothetical protein PIB30_074263 [Stylosanthes scabra]|uniref:Protein FAR1-RELATED SEQUENCE n=1 Tax=Stylosanthes scabra TaxID=79078 RepID=A0ABU6TP93_9FABA|nr:hypothetical protein [Stylosanthes scabra]